MVLELRGYHAWIESDGERLEEYAVEIKGNTVSCYVCSEEGKNFILRFGDNNSKPCSRGIDVRIDGSLVDSLWGDRGERLTSDGMIVGNRVRPYAFARIDTTDDDNVAAVDDPAHEQIGTIQAELRRGTRTMTKANPKTDGFDATEPNTGLIHEKSKKAGSHRVAFGKGKYRRQSTETVKVKYKDRKAWVTFRFLYRKRDILKAQRILPRSPAPSPPPDNIPGPSSRVEGGGRERVKREREEDGDVIELLSDDDDDDKDDKDDLMSLQNELKRIKKRIARKRAKISVKQEAGPSAGNLIDLT